jgi:hypothetical protein
MLDRQTHPQASIPLGLVLLICLVGGLLLSTLGPPGRILLHIEVNSSVGGKSQVFFSADNRVYTEANSRSVEIVEGRNALVFALPNPGPLSAIRLRWDPLDKPGTVLIKRIALETNFLHYEVPLESVSPQIDTAQTEIDNELLIETFSNDSQMVIGYWPPRASRFSMLMGLVYGIVTSAIAIGVYLLYRRYGQDHGTMKTTPAQPGLSVVRRRRKQISLLTFELVLIGFLISWLVVAA